MKKTLTVEQLLSKEQAWRRRRTIADHKLDEIHAEMRRRISKLTSLTTTVERAIAGIERETAAPTKGRKSRKLDLND